MRPKTAGGLTAGAVVIDFTAYRAKRQAATLIPRVLYITEWGTWRAPLQSLQDIELITVDSLSGLGRALADEAADLVVVEQDISWRSCVDVISEIDAHLAIPTVLLCDPTTLKKRPGLVKDAYAAGVHDVLFSPFQADDLHAAIQVLLKMQTDIASVRE